MHQISFIGEHVVAELKELLDHVEIASLGERDRRVAAVTGPHIAVVVAAVFQEVGIARRQDRAVVVDMGADDEQ